jgi:hypothetical protein
VQRGLYVLATILAEKLLASSTATGEVMPLTAEQLDMLDKLGPSNVRERLQYARAGGTSVLPGPVPHSDVEDWLAKKDREASKLQTDTLWWAKAAALIGLGGIIVAVLVAVFGK